MVNIVQLEPDIAVAPQLVEADFAVIAACGFRSVVNNRPEGQTRPSECTGRGGGESAWAGVSLPAREDINVTGMMWSKPSLG